MGKEIHELKNKIDAISAATNLMIPKLDNCLDEIKGINTEQRFIRTILQKHDTTLEFHDKDLAGLGRQVDQLQIAQAIYKTSAKVNGEPIKWTSFIEFAVALPKYAKYILPWIATLISSTWAAWEMLKK